MSITIKFKNRKSSIPILRKLGLVKAAAALEAAERLAAEQKAPPADPLPAAGTEPKTGE